MPASRFSNMERCRAPRRLLKSVLKHLERPSTQSMTILLSPWTSTRKRGDDSGRPGASEERHRTGARIATLLFLAAGGVEGATLISRLAPQLARAKKPSIKESLDECQEAVSEQRHSVPQISMSRSSQVTRCFQPGRCLHLSRPKRLRLANGR